MTAAELDEILKVARAHGLSSLVIPDKLSASFFPPEFNPLPDEVDKSIPGGWKRPPNLEESE